ncbi:MAG TPA: bifunctional phosphoglucose/phosphomannose isomerase [Ignavibacteriaceae bacterium]|nr:bifunctional phosphoglucose/phosphomannose isomerase [Ignavibacteriaceae bacterium]
MQIKDFISKYDPQNQFEVLIETYKQVEYAWSNKFNLSSINKNEIDSIIVTGLGGSAISGDLLQNYLREELKVPYNVNRNYYLPAFANENTLLIVSSYSGNTEETIEVLGQSIKKKCKIVAVTTGGKVGEIAEQNNIPIVKLKEGFQPRYSLGLSFFSLLKVVQSLGLIDNQTEIVNNIISLWKEKGIEFSRNNSQAYNLAVSLAGFIPVIYSCSDLTSAVGYRFKCQVNENSKLHAFHNSIPEMNHNEIIGWESFAESQLNAKIVNIIDEEYHSKIKERFKIASELMKNDGGEIISLESKQPDFKLRLMELIYLCDWISYYLGIIREKDPSEIENINILKKRLS